MFTEKEINFIKSQPLARVSTVSAGGQPDVVPVGFDFDDQYFYVGGRNMEATRKYKNVTNGNNLVALVIDDLASTRPWVVQGIKIYGTAVIVDYEGYAGPGPYLRITPTQYRSWGLD